jgi:hypothetical protein
LRHTNSALRHVNAQLRAETHQRQPRLHYPLYLDTIVFEDGNARCTWINVLLYRREKGNISLDITVRFQTTYWQTQHEQLQDVVVNIVVEAVLNVVLDDGLGTRQRVGRERFRMGDANLWSSEPSQDFTYKLPTRAL